MKLENIELSFDNFASEMSKLKNQKHFDYLVTIIGEDFGEEGYGCIYVEGRLARLEQRGSCKREAQWQ